MNNQNRIAVIGAGAWGTALAIHLARLHSEIFLWGRNSDHLVTTINAGENKKYLPGIKLPENIIAETDFSKIVANATYVLVAVPSTAMREQLCAIRDSASTGLQGIIWATKGLEQVTGKFLHQVAEEELPDNIKIAILSGPSFAQEVGLGLPTAVTIGSLDNEFSQQAAKLFHHPLFRTYTSTDVTGIEIGGTFKNIMAIAAGIVDGLGFGSNARAALITRGVAEMMRFGKQKGVATETLVGLSGIGDIILSCTDNLSRNRRLGLGLGSGKQLADIEKEIGQVLEGKYAAKVINDLSSQLKIELPISEQVYQVLYCQKSPRTAVEDLLSRASKSEVG